MFRTTSLDPTFAKSTRLLLPEVMNCTQVLALIQSNLIPNIKEGKIVASDTAFMLEYVLKKNPNATGLITGVNTTNGVVYTLNGMILTTEQILGALQQFTPVQSYKLQLNLYEGMSPTQLWQYLGSIYGFTIYDGNQAIVLKNTVESDSTGMSGVRIIATISPRGGVKFDVADYASCDDSYHCTEYNGDSFRKYLYTGRNSFTIKELNKLLTRYQV